MNKELEENSMCEYCNLVSGQTKELGRAKKDILKIERHRNSYFISTTNTVDEDDEREINYCPICREKFKRNGVINKC